MTEATTAPTRSPATSKSDTPKSAAPDGKRAKASRALEKARETANDATQRAVASIDANPMSVLVGGVALGVLAGMFAPRSQREAALLLPVGRKVREGAETAARAAVDAGKAELASVGLSRVGASEQVGKLVEGLGKALASASAAAKESRLKGK